MHGSPPRTWLKQSSRADARSGLADVKGLLARLKSLCRNWCIVPWGLDFVPLLLPGTAVPGFPMSPLRGWIGTFFHFLSAFRVATQTLQPCRYGLQRSSALAAEDTHSTPSRERP